MSVLASGGFWAFVGVVAGIYTILSLGLQVQFGFAGLLNFGQVGFMALGAYTMAILVVKEGWSMWLAAPLGVVAPYHASQSQPQPDGSVLAGPRIGVHEPLGPPWMGASPGEEQQRAVEGGQWYGGPL